MKTTESKYTLVVADLLWGDTEPQGDRPALLQSQLDEIVDKGAKVGRGMFLFDTHRDYTSIQLLRQTIQDANRTVVTLPIESELHLACADSIAKLIAEAFPDLKLFREPPRRRQ